MSPIAPADTKFALFQRVRAQRAKSFSLETFTSSYEDDPDSFFDTRVVGWDCFDRICVATTISDNPHCSEWCWSEDRLKALPGDDWFTNEYLNKEGRIRRVGEKVNYLWEMDRWGGWEPSWERGETVPAVLISPHIHYGDWIVSYQKKSGSWITRVINQLQMWERTE